MKILSLSRFFRSKICGKK